MDSGYYIVEVIPKNENYAMRVFFNEKKELVEHYFDISLGNGIDEETKLPYYDDVFLDVTITNGQIEICDEDELDNALSQGEITKETYNFAKEVANKLIEEINSNTNKYVNMNLGEYLK
jgi:predicted RNA-binding protein associated with RNAse of E/G family